MFSASLVDIFDAEVPESWRTDFWQQVRETPHLDWLVLTKRPENIREMLPSSWGPGWHNVWLGVTAENQARADERIPVLLDIPAVVHFASCEPLLGPLDLASFARLDWVIVGGETGHGARPMEAAWARDVRAQCTEAGTAFFFKQWGAHDEGGRRVGKKKAGRVLDGRTWDEVPAAYKARVAMSRRGWEEEAAFSDQVR